MVLVSLIWDVFSPQGEREGAVSGLTMGSGSISQLGRWCQSGSDVGDGNHKRKKLYVTSYRTCIYDQTLFMYWGRLEWVEGNMHHLYFTP